MVLGANGSEFGRCGFRTMRQNGRARAILHPSRDVTQRNAVQHAQVRRIEDDVPQVSRARPGIFFALLYVSMILGVAAIAQQQTSKPVYNPPPRSDTGFDRLAARTEGAIRYQEYERTPLTFSSSTQYVLVPAVVLGRDGKPVRGLKKEDFRISENGKEQKVASVEEFATTAAPVASAMRTAGQFSNVGASVDATPRRLVVIAFDVLNTPFVDRERAKRQLISFLADNVSAGNLYELAIINFHGLQVIHEFTTDSAVLVTALQNVKTQLNSLDTIDKAALTQPPRLAIAGAVGSASVGTTMSPPGMSDRGAAKDTFAISHEEALLASISFAETPYALRVQAEAAEATLRAFQQLAHRLHGVPGRKSLIWISGGFPFSLDPNSAAVSDAVAFAAYQHTMQSLSNAMVSVYPVDARGLLTSSVDASISTRKDPTRANAMLADESTRQLDILSTMRAFADMTGGHAYVNQNDTKISIAEAARDGESYYLLSYALDKNNRKPGWRKISLKAGDYQVRARTGYYATQATVDPQMSAKLDLDNALASLLEYTGIPVKLQVDSPTASGEKRKLAFAMQVPPNATSVDAAGNNHMFVEIAYALRNEAGQDAGHKRVAYNLNLNATQLQAIMTSGVGYNDTVDVPPGNYDLRVVVRDNLNGRIGSVNASVQVK